MSRDKTCEARGCGAYKSGIEGCHDEWFHREARIARLCMMFMQDGGGVRSVRKDQSCELAVPIARAHVGARGSLMAGPTRLGELYGTMPFGEAMDGGRGGNRYREGRLGKTDNF